MSVEANQMAEKRDADFIFCGKHLSGFPPLCSKCLKKEEPFTPKKDHPDWIRHKLKDESWEQWRKENKGEVKKLKALM